MESFEAGKDNFGNFLSHNAGDQANGIMRPATS